MSYIESVPIGVMKQLTERFALGSEPFRKTEHFEARLLDEKKVGFGGAISLRRYDAYIGEGVEFLLHARPEDIGAFAVHHLLEIQARTSSSGTWSYGSGEKMEEVVAVRSQASIFLTNEKHRAMAKLIGIVLRLAAELSKGVVGESFWEVERRPGGIFEEP